MLKFIHSQWTVCNQTLSYLHDPRSPSSTRGTLAVFHRSYNSNRLRPLASFLDSVQRRIKMSLTEDLPGVVTQLVFYVNGKDVLRSNNLFRCQIFTLFPLTSRKHDLLHYKSSIRWSRFAFAELGNQYFSHLILQ